MSKVSTLAGLRRLLVVDDDLVTRKAISMGLRRQGMEVFEASGGYECLEQCRNGTFDLLIVDMVMPGLSGDKLILAIRLLDTCADIPILVMSAESGQASKNEAFSAGAVDYVVKPVHMNELLHRVRVHCELQERRQQVKRYAEEMESLAKSRAEQLLVADRLTTLGMLAAGVAHEINNPMTFIAGNAQTLEQQYWPVIRSGLETIVKSESSESAKARYILAEMPSIFKSFAMGTSRIHSIIQNLKIYARDNNEAGASCAPAEAVRDALLLAKGSFNLQPKLIVVVPDDLPKVAIDIQKLEQIIINLTVNAAHALEGRADPKIEITSRLDGQFLALRIADNGTGIPDSVLPKIWEPFFTTKPAGKGTGLGLAIIREILDKAGGRIEARNRREGGAVFEFHLPIVPVENPS
jgi:two-component system, NtrC family, sensor kinase